MSTFDIIVASGIAGFVSGASAMIYVISYLINDGQLKMTDKWFKK